MAFYVSAISSSGRRSVLALGPYRRQGSALAEVDRFRAWAAANTREGALSAAFGTARHRTSHEPGRFNEALGLPSEGWLDDGLVSPGAGGKVSVPKEEEHQP